MNISSTRKNRGAISAAASLALLAMTNAIQAQPIGNPNAGNGWSTTSVVSVAAHSGQAPLRDITHWIDGGGITGANGELMLPSSGAAGLAYFGMSRFPAGGGEGASPPTPGSLEGSGSGHWAELTFLDGPHALNDLAIWNDNQDSFDQGWKHLTLQVSTDHSTWTTVVNNILLPASPGPGGDVPAHGTNSTLPAAVLNLGGVMAEWVAFINPATGNETNYYHDYNGGDSADNFDLTEVRFNSGLTAGTPPQPFVWKTNGIGNWLSNGNWSTSLAPSGVDSIAKFMGIITADRSVVVDAPVTVGSIIFNNAHRYNITGSSNLTIQSTTSGLIDVQAGPQKINLPLTFQSSTNVNVAGGASLTIGNPTTIKSGATVTKAGTLVVQAPLTIENNGALVINSGSTTLFTAPNLTGTAKIDVKNNSVTVDYSGAGSAAAAILAQLTSGYNGGAWNGAGINTSSAIVNQTALGWKDDPASQSLFIKYTRYGDADLSGTVDTIDFNILVANFSQSGKVWNNGDFNYSGTVDTIDFNLLASNFAQSAPAPALGGLVPEPASAASLIGALAALMASRRR